MNKMDKIQAAKRYVVTEIERVIEKSYDDGWRALETPGTFTALLEAFRACEIALEADRNTRENMEKAARLATEKRS